MGVPELLIIAGVIILLFGARKLPEMARSLGKSAKAFKEETKGMRGGDGEAADETAQTPPAQPQAAAAPQQLPQAQPPAPNATQQVNGVHPAEQSQQNKNAG
ncbi:Sec-independent protein translocase subunit TatA [Actinophytocola sediminis]